MKFDKRFLQLHPNNIARPRKTICRESVPMISLDIVILPTTSLSLITSSL